VTVFTDRSAARRPIFAGIRSVRTNIALVVLVV
jgi:hypothetical protein